MDHLADLSLCAASSGLESGAFTSVALTEACLDRIEVNAQGGAFLHVDAEGAMAQATASDIRRKASETKGPLDGVPLGVKDIFLVADQPTTCASLLLDQFIAPYEGGAVSRLRNGGSIFLGKLNMDEFAMGSSNEHSAMGPVYNPWDDTRVPGGSSGGSAVAVASGQAFATLGTDTGGSIRQPSAFCGNVGLKPTYGRVSRYGVIAFASSLDQVGPMTRNIHDCACVLQAIAGHDPNDATSANVEVPQYAEQIDAGVKGLRLGVPKEYFVDGIEPEVRTAVESALALYESLGATLVPVSLPHTEYAIAAYYLISTAEASSNLARYDGVRYGRRVGGDEGLGAMYAQTRGRGFGSEVKRRIMLGTYVLSSGYYDAYYIKAQKVRSMVCQDFETVFAKVDALVTPTTPSVAFAMGAHTNDPLQMYLSDVFTVGCNLAGLPGVSLPCGFSQAGLPMGLQVIGPGFEEARILQIARAYEREHSWHSRRPGL